MRRGSLRERVRAAARELDRAAAGFEFKDLSDFLRVQTRQEEKSLRYAVQDLLKAGDLKRRDDKRLGSVEQTPGAPTKQQIMWRFLRMNRVASPKELRAVSGASERTVKDFCKAAARRGLAEVLPDGSLRICANSQTACPFDEVRADRVKGWRERQKQALAKLDAAAVAVAQARRAVSDMEEG